MSEEARNWAGNYQYAASTRLAPATVEELQEAVAAADRVKALGTRHSFNGIADTSGTQVSLRKLDRILGLDEEAGTVTVEGGARYGELGRFLHERGMALMNLASLPHISVAGAVATATHGSGDRNASLASSVTAVEIVRADGGLVRVERGDAAFPAAVVSLGALGVTARLALAVRPAFQVRQRVYQGLPFAALERHLDEVTGAAYSVSLFTTWQGESVEQVWLKGREDDGALPDGGFLGAAPAARDLHPISSMPATNTTPQLGVPGPWHERLPHFRLEFTPSAGE
ncbi:MAG TPA: FAD-binding protein [Deinococcales bacterium]|nr:FAD-binding protein [Deinococcales bacterium]